MILKCSLSLNVVVIINISIYYICILSNIMMAFYIVYSILVVFSEIIILHEMIFLQLTLFLESAALVQN